MRRFSRLPLLAAALCATPALADDIYRWTDAQGQVHYTNDPATLPTNQKVEKTQGAELTVIQTKKGEEAPPPPATTGKEKSTPAAEPEQKQKTPTPEETWRERFRKAREDVARAERDVSEARATLADPGSHGIGMVYNSAGAAIPNPELDKVRARLARSEQEAEQAQRRLDELDREASRSAVPREWRR